METQRQPTRTARLPAPFEALEGLAVVASPTGRWVRVQAPDCVLYLTTDPWSDGYSVSRVDQNGNVSVRHFSKIEEAIAAASSAKAG